MTIRTIIVAAVASLSMTTMSLGDWVTELTASDSSAHAYFGTSVAIDGDTCVIGAHGSALEGQTGSAYVFTNTGGTWSQVAKLTASDGASHDFFGESVAIDGDTCLIGAPGTDGIGSAFVFTKSGDTWSQFAELASGDIDGRFGMSVAIDGDTCVIGAYGTNSGTGSAYVYTKSAGTWIQVQKLTATGGASGDAFGSSLALDGDTCVIGAQGTDSAYVFTKSGGTWSQVQQLTDPDEANYNQFGFGLALDGDTCVIGSHGTNNGTGIAYVFTKSGGTWSQVAELTASDGAWGDIFGISVAIDGDTCVIGASGTHIGTGSAYFFTKSGGTWSQAAELTALDGADYDFFGTSIAIDGDTYVIGASGTNKGAGTGAGSAYVYGSGSSDVDNDGACCYDGRCFSITEAECAAVGGSFTAEACAADTTCPTSCSSDSDNDGDVDIEDLLNLLSAYGACP